MAADEEILPGAAEIVSVQEGGCHCDGDQESLDRDDDPKSAVVGHPELVTGAPVEGEELVYFSERKVSKKRELCPLFYSVNEDAEGVAFDDLKEEGVEVLKPFDDDADGDVQQRVELQDVDSLNVVTMLATQAIQGSDVGGDQEGVGPVTPLCRLNLSLNFNGRVHRLSSKFKQRFVCVTRLKVRNLLFLIKVVNITFCQPPG